MMPNIRFKSASNMCITLSLSILGTPGIFSNIRLMMRFHHLNAKPCSSAMFNLIDSISNIASRSDGPSLVAGASELAIVQ